MMSSFDGKGLVHFLWIFEPLSFVSLTMREFLGKSLECPTKKLRGPANSSECLYTLLLRTFRLYISETLKTSRPQEMKKIAWKARFSPLAKLASQMLFHEKAPRTLSCCANRFCNCCTSLLICRPTTWLRREGNGYGGYGSMASSSIKIP